MFYNVHETYDFETAALKNVEARDRDQFDPVNKTMSTNATNEGTVKLFIHIYRFMGNSDKPGHVKVLIKHFFSQAAMIEEWRPSCG